MIRANVWLVRSPGFSRWGRTVGPGIGVASDSASRGPRGDRARQAPAGRRQQFAGAGNLPWRSRACRCAPYDEPYRIPAATAHAIFRAKADGGRLVAIGTTVVRALEHAAVRDGTVRPGEGLTTQRIGGSTRLRIVDASLTGTHEPGSSHYELLRTFAGGSTLQRASAALEERRYRTHEFGDSMLIEKARIAPRTAGAVAPPLVPLVLTSAMEVS